MKNEIYKNLLRLEKLEEIANHAEADYERDPENREFEETFDRAYKKARCWQLRRMNFLKI